LLATLVSFGGVDDMQGKFNRLGFYKQVMSKTGLIIMKNTTCSMPDRLWQQKAAQYRNRIHCLPSKSEGNDCRGSPNST
jgi:hypothetical protein